MLNRIPFTVFPSISLLILTTILSTGCGEDNAPTWPSDGTIQITASTFEFKPKRIALYQGEGVTLRLTSTDTRHTFTIDALKVDVNIPAGETVTVELTGTTEGAYTFYCAVPGHREQGMEGTLSVTKRPNATGRSSGRGY